MKFDALNEKMFNTLTEDNFLLSEQDEKIVKLIKQGSHLSLVSDSKDNLNKVLIYTALSKAPEAFEGSPRVLWITNSEERLQSVVSQLRALSRRTEMAVETANDKGKIIQQRNDIFEGADIIVGNPKRLLEIYNQNGIHVNQLSIVIIDELDAICKNPNLLQNVKRICESIEKCMKLMVRYGDHQRVEPFIEEICATYNEVSIP